MRLLPSRAHGPGVYFDSARDSNVDREVGKTSVYSACLWDKFRTTEQEVVRQLVRKLVLVFV